MGRTRVKKISPVAMVLDTVAQTRVPKAVRDRYSVIVEARGLNTSTALRVHMLETIEQYDRQNSKKKG